MIKKIRTKIVKFITPDGSDIQISAFIILAMVGVAVCLVSAINSLIVEPEAGGFIENIIGVFISLGLLIYTKKTGNYRLAIVLTIIIIFLGLFTTLFVSGGGYHSGMPAFFIFAVVFTAFMLRGKLMPVFVAIELAWYTLLCLYVYKNPQAVVPLVGEEAFLTDVLVCMIVVSISLAITMYFQLRVYRKKQLELNVAVKAADEANKAKSDFLAKMSHDIRTPLNTIMAMNEMIINNTSSAKIREWVNDSNVSGRILISLIEDMLDLTKIEAGRIVLLEEAWDTGKLFDEIITIWKPQADRSGLEFIQKIDPEIPSLLLGDEGVIRKIVNNLLSNSIKYTKQGSVSLTVRWTGSLEIEVADTGVGIAPEYLDKIFKPFERGIQEIYKETSGSGLGLAIVKELVDAAGGTIECKSTLNEGTTFNLSLPQKEVSSWNASMEDRAESPEDTYTEQFVAPNARILVVDDNAFNRKVIECFLEPSLIQIDDVESGDEALEMIDILDYDLVLMDLRMPKMDGAETLDKIREEYPDFKTPVVVLTADIMDGVEERMLKHGFAAFLPKPINSARLYETIARFIPDKIVSIKTEHENGLTLAKVESYQDMFIPSGINLKLALEYNAGSTDEFLNRVDLFDKFADDNISLLEDPDYIEGYWLHVHSIKSIAKGVGAYLLAQLAETAELRRDIAYSKEVNPVIIQEYKRVREGLKKFREEASINGGVQQ
ncbi:MAG: response regulator [Lachnospiraceae bacterium]|nr:response regulator [Lachnospiraceae bacterium]